MDIAAADLEPQALYKLLTGTIVPRPIGWVSTMSPEGVPNLAPYSFFNGVCANPPHVLFCAGVVGEGTFKDTLVNVKTTGEFVINIVTEALAEAMNQTAASLAPHEDEFAFAGLKTAPSVAVKPLRVADSPVHFECTIKHIYEVGDWVGAGSVVIGEVVHLHIDERVLQENYRIDHQALKPVGRLAGSLYCHTTNTFTMMRP